MAIFGIPFGETLKASSQTSAADLVLLLRRQQDLLDLVSNSAGIDQIVKRLVEFADESFRSARCAIFELDPDLGLVRRFSADHVTDDVSESALDALKAILKEAKPSLVPETDISIASALVEHFGQREGRAFAEPISDGGDAIRRVLAVYDPQSCVGQETVQAFAGYVGCAIGAANKARGDTERFERLTAAIPGVIYQRRVTADGDIRYTYISEGARELFGYSPEEIISDPATLFGTFGPEYRARFRERLLAASRALSTWDVEATIITPDGKKKYTHAMARPSREADGSVLWTGLILDETRMREALLDSLSQGFVLYDPQDRLVIRNTHFIDLFPALGEMAVPGASYQDIVRAELGAGAGGSEPLHSEFVRRTAIHTEKRGSYEHQVNADTWVLVTEHATNEGGTVVLYTDVSELKRRDNQIRYLAFHDPVTALANRTLFNQRLEEALVEAKARGTRVAVLCVDLENFKEVNDRCGDPAGDEILKRFAERLRTCCGPRDTLARLGGDEFGFVITELEQPEIATTLAWKILETVAQPIHHNGQDITLSLSVGIDLSGPNANEPTTLLKNADLAMYRAKADGCGTFRFFEAEMDARARDRRTMERELRQAIERNEIELHYQPQINANTDEILGFEALLRWHHPTRGLLCAEHFVPLAEETGLIIPIGEWVLRQACLDIKAWPESLYVSVNISPVQFRNHDLALLVADVLEESELPGHRLEIEVTESLLSREMKTNLLTLHGLKRLGVRIAMDDFGTGFSSLRNLRSFPFDKIKIDRSYVGELDRDPDSAAIVRAVLGLGRSLGLATCAEGVETKEQLMLLRAEGCREVQGSFFSDPIAAKEISDLLQMGASRPVYRIVTAPLG